MIHPQLSYWLAALYMHGAGPKKILAWLRHFSSMAAMFNATEDALRAAGMQVREVQTWRHPNWQQIETDLHWIQQENQHIVCLEDAAYPALLKEINDPPLVLFVRGALSALQHTQLAMVGSRHATQRGMQTAEAFAQSLAQAGLAITSGLALGVDAASHHGALRANGITLGVAGTGLNHIYPRAHIPLVQKIIEQGGAIISEFPLETTAHAAHFPRRNRIIAGMSMGVLVVEAVLKSGSLITARLALEQGREVFAIPGSIHQPLSRGCNHLIREGAKLVETAEDILEELKLSYPVVTQPDPDMEATEWQVFKQIAYEITPIDMILLRTGLTASVVSSILLTLELKGYIQSVPGGYIRLCANLRAGTQ